MRWLRYNWEEFSSFYFQRNYYFETEIDAQLSVIAFIIICAHLCHP
jgi:hypothetical protein